VPDDDDPIAHGHEAAVQAVTVLATVAGELSRRSAIQIQSRSDEIARSEARDRAQRAAAQARDAVRWAPMLDRDLRGTATTPDAMAAWTAAVGWAETNRAAMRAARLAETLLRHREPAAMAVFDAQRIRGVEARAAMRAASEHIRVAGHNESGAGLDGLASALARRADAGDAAAERTAAPPDAAVAVPDEHVVGLQGVTAPDAAVRATRTPASGTTLDARHQAATSVDFPVVITTVPVRSTPSATDATARTGSSISGGRTHGPAIRP
jgi:hypothetical protein